MLVDDGTPLPHAGTFNGRMWRFDVVIVLLVCGIHSSDADENIHLAAACRRWLKWKHTSPARYRSRWQRWVCRQPIYMQMVPLSCSHAVNTVFMRIYYIATKSCSAALSPLHIFCRIFRCLSFAHKNTHAETNKLCAIFLSFPYFNWFTW